MYIYYFEDDKNNKKISKFIKLAIKTAKRIILWLKNNPDAMFFLQKYMLLSTL